MASGIMASRGESQRPRGNPLGLDTFALSPEPPPQKNEHPAVYDLVIADMVKRDEGGQKKYGTRLQPFNGRDPLVDAYQELLDAAAYMRQLLFEKYGR